MSIRMSAASREFIPVEVEASVDPTNDAVAMAFLPAPEGYEAEPVSGDFHTAEWDPLVTSSPYKALCEVGVGAVALTPGEYVVWLKISDSPEVPVRPVDRLIIFGETP